MLDNESQILKDILLAAPECSKELIAEAEEEHDRTGKPFREVVVNCGVLSNKRLLELIAENLGTEVVILRAMEIPQEIIALMTSETANGYGVIPVTLEGNAVKVAMRNPLSYQVTDDLRFVLGKDIIPLVADPEEVEMEKVQE